MSAFTCTLGTQKLVPTLEPTIVLVPLVDTTCGLLQSALDAGDNTKVLGVSLRLSKRGVLETIALATPTTAFLITVSGIPPGPFRNRKNPIAQSKTSLAAILDNPHCLLAGFKVSRTALILHKHTGAHVYGVDLSTLHAKSTAKPTSPADLACNYLSINANKQLIHALWLRDDDTDLCLQAWLSACFAERCIEAVAKSSKVDTRHLLVQHLACLAQLVLNVELLESDKPTHFESDFDSESVQLDSDGKVVLRNTRYKTRVRRSNQTVIEINDGEAHAQAISLKGKTTGLALKQGTLPKKVEKVRVIGREEATNAELARDEFVLRVLQGATPLHASSFVQMLWFPAGAKRGRKGNAIIALSGTTPATPLDDMTPRPPSFEQLNPSQLRVAHAMISADDPVVIAHGPPGTGKTSTIAAALKYWQSLRQSAWVIAHSNVGVQNIAVSLFEKGVDFKIIVSKEFHFEWHEHIYERIEHCLIRTDDFGDAFDPKNQIGETKTILCTLSMLSNPAMELNGILKHVPVKRLVIDEASQIDTFEFMHLFDKFDKVLSKVCMFGDPNQLPPFGAEVAPMMKTIFDFKHLMSSAYFLDTQYRMPTHLGNFISETMYKSELKSKHEINDQKCVAFIDVRKGKEEGVGSSWKNMEEVHTIVNIVRLYYQHREFCVITPYDAQRAAITAALKQAGLPRFDQVYNVDSFQGHEAPFIIVSAVRTSSPGFLRLQNRMNVMLTRCKTGLVLVTNRQFLQKAGSGTLLGRLARYWAQRVGDKRTWVDAMEVAQGRAVLPAEAPGKKGAVGKGATMVQAEARALAAGLARSRVRKVVAAAAT